MDFPTALRLTSMVLALATALPLFAATELEGRIKRASARDACYDFRIEVWDISAGAGTPKLLRTIQIPMVQVAKGAFKIVFDANLDGLREGDLSIKIESRPFEGWEPFRPAEVSRVRNNPILPSLVIR